MTCSCLVDSRFKAACPSFLHPRNRSTEAFGVTTVSVLVYETVRACEYDRRLNYLRANTID